MHGSGDGHPPPKEAIILTSRVLALTVRVGTEYRELLRMRQLFEKSTDNFLANSYKLTLSHKILLYPTFSRALFLWSLRTTKSCQPQPQPRRLLLLNVEC